MSRETKLARVYSQAEGSPADLLRRLMEGGPSLVWAEPVPRRERLPHFPGLWGDPAECLRCLDGVALEEARLFWREGAIHLVAAGGRTRWAAFWEPAGGPPPTWLGPLGADGQSPHSEPFHAATVSVLTLRASDRRRYGLAHLGTASERNLRLTTYRRGTDLVFWRLEP
jgi:hypothetical protein